MKHVPRLYVFGHLAAGGLVLDGDQAKRLSAVMRLGPGDEFLAFAGDGREWRARVTGVHKASLDAEVTELVRQEPAPALAVEVWVALVRANRFDWAIEKCVEAGADVIRPMLTERCQRGEGSSGKAGRWTRLAIEAAEQSGRLRVPVVEPPVALERLLGGVRGALLVAERGALPWTEAARLLAPAGHVAVAIGPEGGLSESELGQLKAKGAIAVSLGPYILRTETAAAVAVALVRAAALVTRSERPCTTV